MQSESQGTWGWEEVEEETVEAARKEDSESRDSRIAGSRLSVLHCLAEGEKSGRRPRPPGLTRLNWPSLKTQQAGQDRHNQSGDEIQ